MRKLIAVLTLALAGCESTETTPPPPSEPVVDRLEFKMLSKEQTYETCLAGAEGCTYVRLDYPVLVDAPDGYAVTAITQRVFATINAAYRDEEPYPDADTLMHAFIQDYRELVLRQPSYEEPWFLERKVFVLHNTPELVSLSVTERAFTGGTQELPTVRFLNLDPRTGEDVTLGDILVDDYETELLPIAEARFRAVRGIEEEMSLSAAGFAFALTDNVAIGEDGLTFYYNASEVAPASLGATEIVLDYGELAGLLKN